MTHWLTNFVVGKGNVIRERSFTNWNTFDASEVVAEKEKERASLAQTHVEMPADSNEDANLERD
jgi:hypothetical protein